MYLWFNMFEKSIPLFCNYCNYSAISIGLILIVKRSVVAFLMTRWHFGVLQNMQQEISMFERPQ